MYACFFSLFAIFWVHPAPAQSVEAAPQRRRTTTKLSKFFGVNNREDDVGTMRQVMYIEALLDSAVSSHRAEANLSPLPVPEEPVRSSTVPLSDAVVVDDADFHGSIRR